ncbi:SsrA-binding protein SmpB [Candidatus Uhrbacteria bacterium]|nr:SsrA-binding protein SmpB [Candidatus Uhrbacteria bacterium]
MTAKKPKKKGTIAAARRARFDYEILETLEAGIALTGAEVKAVREGDVQLQGSYVTVDPTRATLRGAHIGRYKPAGNIAYDSTRERQLLLHTRELKRWFGKRQEAGLTVVPLRVYMKGRLVKVEIALARGKKNYEKRAAIKKKELDRELRTRMYTRDE